MAISPDMIPVQCIGAAIIVTLLIFIVDTLMDDRGPRRR